MTEWVQRRSCIDVALKFDGCIDREVAASEMKFYKEAMESIRKQIQFVLVDLDTAFSLTQTIETLTEKVNRYEGIFEVASARELVGREKDELDKQRSNLVGRERKLASEKQDMDYEIEKKTNRLNKKVEKLQKYIKELEAKDYIDDQNKTNKETRTTSSGDCTR